MNSKGYTVGSYLIKSEKKKSDLPMCTMCKKCKDRSICQNIGDRLQSRNIPFGISGNSFGQSYFLVYG